jgi:hypothetical protein
MKFIVIRKNGDYKSKKDIPSKNDVIQDSCIGFRLKKPKEVISAFLLIYCKTVYFTSNAFSL